MSGTMPSQARATAPRTIHLLVSLLALSAAFAPAASASHNAIEKVSAGPTGGMGPLARRSPAG